MVVGCIGGEIRALLYAETSAHSGDCCAGLRYSRIGELGGYLAKLTLRDCRGRAKAATKPLERPQDRDDIVFDGIFMGVADRSDFAGRFGPRHYLP